MTLSVKIIKIIKKKKKKENDPTKWQFGDGYTPRPKVYNDVVS